MRTLPALIGVLLLVSSVSALTWTSVNGCWTATDGGDIVVKFNTTGLQSFKMPNTVSSIEYIVVGGGGSGGETFSSGSNAGGGGAGGLLSNTIGYQVLPGSTYTIVVGQTGAVQTTNYYAGNNGTFSLLQNSSTVIANATGGGGGGGYGQGAGPLYSARAGGSGGGGGYPSNTAGAGIAGQGYVGGVATAVAAPGGGGGSGSAGSSGAASGMGGNGTVLSVSGENILYCVGGNGGQNTTTYGVNITTPNVGWGGNGAANVAGHNIGATGSNGTVIIRYVATAPVSSFNIVLTDTSTNSPTSWKWNATNLLGNNTEFTFSTSQSPIFNLGTGNWKINLTAINGVGSDTTSQIIGYNLTSPKVYFWNRTA